MAGPIAPISAFPLDSNYDKNNIIQPYPVINDPALSGGVSQYSFATTLLANSGNNPTNTSLTLYNSQSVNTLSSVPSIDPTSFKGNPNILNDYENYTYHVVFSMMSEVRAGGSTPKSVGVEKEKIIIAETGVTGAYNISKFSIKNVVAPGAANQNMTATTWSMTINEPFGLTLSDYVLGKAKNDLKVQNIFRFPFFIEVWFTGYKSDGTIVDKIPGTYKVWRVLWLESSLQTTQAGTTYELTGCIDNDLALSNEVAVMKSGIKLENNVKLGDMLDKFAKALTDDRQQGENVEPNKGSVKYKIVLLDESMKDWQIDFNSTDSGEKLNSPAGGIEFNITRGQDIANFITTAITRCVKFKDFYNSLPASSVTIKSHGLAGVIQIIPRMEVGEFNTKTREYQRTVTYYVKPFLTPRCVHDPDGAIQQKNINVQKSKFDYLANKKMLAKRYDYYYTGKNTEVIKFDVHVEKFWQIILPMYFGAKSFTESSHGALADNQSTAWREQAQASSIPYKSFYTSLLQVAQTIDQTISLFDLTKLSNSIFGGTSATDATKSNFLNEAQKIINSIPTLAQTTPFFGTNLNSLTSSILQNNTNNDNTLGTYYPGQIDTRYQQYLAEYATNLNIGEDDPQQVAFSVDIASGQTMQSGGTAKTDSGSVGTNSIYPIGPGMFSQIMGNLFEDKFFINISLQIRGDPWWLGMGNLEQNEYLDNKNNSIYDSQSYNFANYIVGENMFLLTFRTATEYSEETGLMDGKDSQYFNGIYSVLTVEHNFENGSFTQEIKAYKEMFSQQLDKKFSSTN